MELIENLFQKLNERTSFQGIVQVIKLVFIISFLLYAFINFFLY